jgi:hypothetical protein
MASCNGIAASSMAHAYDSVFSYLIGNTGPVLQSDLTVAYLAFYNQIFLKGATLEQSVTTMKSTSGDQNFSTQADSYLIARSSTSFPVVGLAQVGKPECNATRSRVCARSRAVPLASR